MLARNLKWTLVFSLAIWVAAISFFIFFGHVVLIDPDQEGFLLRFLLLEIMTGVALYGVMLIYQRCDHSKDAVIKLGIWGSAIGLFLDSFAIWHHSIFLPNLSNGQVMAFTIWLGCAYALYLMIPVWMRRVKN
ncbi:DUF5367 family protein [Thermoflavimicrobium daqui]|jgi:hypothetical protein|uniref:DUF5367 domain-containing protein n=1 Tax=Thermoflavimicrobium daqui TaxID=2137476 RepID=A0A364K782_9BACL|nr:DUF5367 family protein [Thermoflavimicrobium daqui]RAL26161.1 hypothetical protein DL897_03950 [Thermoflavimicrobium daqui]